jgi:hypothetical protein
VTPRLFRSHDAGTIDVVLVLTALILLLRPLDVWWVAGLVLAGAGLAILFERVRRHAVTWWLLSSLVIARIVVVWPLSDNHIYLLAYWCAAIGIALMAPSPAASLADGSRWLLGAAFTLAVLWKALLSPDYLDGRFFRVTLMTDDRFADVVMLAGGLTADQIRANRDYLAPLAEGAALLEPPPYAEPPGVRLLATAMTWGGVALEATIAALCLLPVSGRLILARHAALMLFCLTAYALAPVAGFGWLIATMGLAQCRADQRVLRSAYVVVFFIVLLYSEVPWAGVIADWVNVA